MLRGYSMHGRVIVHADLDCFYCQVEHVRLGIPTSTPLAVQQWDGIIAVNYTARKFGVKRGDRAGVALKKCPQIKLVHVETISAEAAASGEGERGDDGAGTGAAATADTAGARRDRGACKVSLERYRKASFAIMAIFQAHCRRVERASIDEAYLDFTEEAAKLCQAADAGGAKDVANAPETDLQGTAGHRVDPTNAFDRALLAGARLTAAMRETVELELGFTVSAGIASNKVLAKLASSINKPNKQTVVPAGASSDLLDTVPVRNVRGLGGKLGEAVVSWSKAEAASDLKRFSEQDLVGNFGSKTGEWLWRACRGMDDEPVTPNLKPKSLSVCKSFTPIHHQDGVLEWIRLLCSELAHRVVVDREAWSRRATKLTLQIISLKPRTRVSQQASATDDGGKNNTATVTRSRTVDIPGGSEPPHAASLVSGAMTMFTKTENALPCSRLALTAHEFTSLVSGRGSIASFLHVLPSPAQPPGPGVVKHMPKATGADQSQQSGIGPVPAERCAGGVGSERRSDCTRIGGREMTTDPRDTRHFSPESCCSRSGSGDSDRVWGSNTGRSHPSEGTSKAPPPDRSNEDDHVCPKCGAVLAAHEDLQEHLDFHYAEGLQERYAREESAAQSRASVMPDRGGALKRRTREAGGKRANNKAKRPAGQKIDSFFKPA